MSRLRLSINDIALGVCVLALCLLVCAGCKQGTTTPFWQTSDQATDTDTRTEQAAATMGGSETYVWIVNAPGRGKLPSPGENVMAGLGETGAQRLIDQLSTTADSDTLSGTDAGYAQAGIHLTINTQSGGTTPSLTGTTTGTATATQTPSGQQTVSPVQDVKPETSASVPIGVAMPGGMVDQQATATGKGTTEGTTKTSENDLIFQRLEAVEKTIDRLVPLLEAALPAPTTQPVDRDATDGSSGG